MNTQNPWQNSQSRRIELVSPKIVQIDTKQTKYLFVFISHEDGWVKRVEGYKTCHWNKGVCYKEIFSEHHKYSDYCALLGILDSLKKGTSLNLQDVDWVVSGFSGACPIENSFEKIKEKFCI